MNNIEDGRVIKVSFPLMTAPSEDYVQDDLEVIAILDSLTPKKKTRKKKT